MSNISAIPPGYAVVPVEPTEKMVNAPFKGKAEGQCVQTQQYARKQMAKDYKAMLSAAPSIPVAEIDTQCPYDTVMPAFATPADSEESK